MSPDDIAQVTQSWQQALADPVGLLEAIGNRLPGAPAFRAERAAWIVRSVSLLSPVLDHPTAFAPAAFDLISMRFPVTTDELAAEREALMTALQERCTLSAETTQAWNLAIDLFGEIVCAIGLDPFGLPRARPVNATSGYP